MKSFSGDEGYQAPCSPCLIEQESYTANYVVCIPLVSTVLPGGLVQAAAAPLRRRNADVIRMDRVNNSPLFLHDFHSHFFLFSFLLFFFAMGGKKNLSRVSSEPPLEGLLKRH